MERSYPDWSEFKTKAKGSVRDQFESLCRILFCDELGIEQGSLVAVKNQAGNETQIVLHNGKLVGFQSKFFDSQFNVQEFKASIFKAKKYNQEQNTIYLYSNCLPTDTQLKNIEKYVVGLGMEYEIRFDKQILDKVATCNNRLIYETFFQLHSEVERLIKSGVEKTESYLKDIHHSICYGDTNILLERQSELETLKSCLSNGNVVAIIGHGGCGKSGLVKMLLEELGEGVDAVRIVRGERLNSRNVAEMIGADDQLFVEAYKSFENKMFVVDSAEQIHLYNCGTELAFLFRRLKKNGWKIIFTCRKDESNVLLNFIHDKLDTDAGIVEIDAITEKNLHSLSKKYGFWLPHDRHLRDYIRIPMNLCTYLNSKDTSREMTFRKFKQNEWNEKIRGESDGFGSVSTKREKVVIGLARALYLEAGNPVNLAESDRETLVSLAKEHILYYDKDGD